MYVITADQRGSRRDVDRVDATREMLASIDTVRAFDRTAGDEIQAVFDDPVAVVEALTTLFDDGHWSVGIGAGPVDEPLPLVTRAGRGPAFEYARTAVEDAKRHRVPVSVHGEHPDACRRAQTAARLLGDLLISRSAAGREAVAALSTAGQQSDAAATLGITPQAMSQRLRSARWDLDQDSRLLVTDLLAAAEPIDPENQHRQPRHEG
ncbi:hypothetical protein [Williamsia sterculiae]|uniref:SatD family (SatD) n=1 Tax=Williamsia sterculiae TaxID=1344003 RepID=A0A1N7EL64_9NOCA|nr:hypothetical protein [Williamsia sterculiae]SIR88768.1 hypothetical protein SAMN05445060_1423 [Williamsia sterculiae]